jgi:hypothetical protein
MDSNVGWFGDVSTGSASFVSTFPFLTYIQLFVISLAISVIYGVMGINAAEHSRNNTLGVDEYGNRAVFPHRQFLLTTGVGLLGTSLFMPTMTTFIDAFVCNFNVKPFVMLRDPTIECLGDTHFLLIALSLVGIGIYYPLSTFLYPDFQYGDKTLDVKYKATYLVMYV